LTRFYVDYELVLAGVMALVGLPAVSSIWSSGRISFVIIATVVALLIFCLQAGLLYFAMARPLDTLIEKIQE
jgi:hypothetical protein